MVHNLTNTDMLKLVASRVCQEVSPSRLVAFWVLSRFCFQRMSLVGPVPPGSFDASVFILGATAQKLETADPKVQIGLGARGAAPLQRDPSLANWSC